MFLMVIELPQFLYARTCEDIISLLWSVFSSFVQYFPIVRSSFFLSRSFFGGASLPFCSGLFSKNRIKENKNETRSGEVAIKAFFFILLTANLLVVLTSIIR